MNGKRIGRRQYGTLIGLVERHADTISVEALTDWDRTHEEWMSGSRFVTIGSALAAEILNAAREDGVTEEEYRAIKRIANVKREGN